MSTTLVSALLHIDDPRPRLADKHRHFYREWVKSVLGLDCPIVFNADEHYFDSIRRELKWSRMLLWNEKLERTQAYKDFHAPVSALMSSLTFLAKPFDHDGLQWTQPLYLMVIFQKLYWLVETAQMNPFNTDWFCWLDAGGIRHKIEPGIKWPNTDKLDPEKVNMFVVSTPRQLEEKDWERHCLSHAAMITGTCFVGKKEPLKVFLELFKAMVNECLGKGFIGSEQKIYDFCYSRHPEMFALHDASGELGIKDVWFKFFDYLKL